MFIVIPQWYLYSRPEQYPAAKREQPELQYIQDAFKLFSA